MVHLFGDLSFESLALPVELGTPVEYRKLEINHWQVEYMWYECRKDMTLVLGILEVEMFKEDVDDVGAGRKS